jgi:2,4-diaminopentanoate dehydrogenase
LRVSVYGAGQVGTATARLLAAWPGISVSGPFGRGQRDEALSSGADAVVIATTSFLDQVAPDIEAAVAGGSNVITTAEEAAYPWHYGAGLAAALDAAARERGVSILGAGLNPGYIFDALVVTALGVVPSVGVVPGAAMTSAVRVERVVDLSGFSRAILRRLGIGYSLDEFTAGSTGGTITGHIGFPQSMRIVARRIGIAIDRIDRAIEPIMADAAIELPRLAVAPGQSAGFRQRYVAIAGGEPWFEALFTGHVSPAAAGHQTRDEIWIDGAAGPLHLVVNPGINPQAGAPAIVAHSIRRLIDAPPGWLTVADLPPASPAASPQGGTS